MRIAHIVCTFPPYYGGMGNVAFEMASGLQRLGHEVLIFTPQYKEPAPENVERVRRLKPRFSYGNAASIPQIKKELSDFDLVHLHYPFFGTAGIVRQWKLRHPEIPLVVSYHMDPRAPSWKGLLFSLYAKWYMPKILSSADAIVSASLDYIEHSDAKTHFLEHTESWKEIPFGVDIKRFVPAPKPEELFQEHDLDPLNPTLLFVGGMDAAHYFKGVDILLRAMVQVHREMPQVQLVLVGDGELREGFELKSKGMGLERAVRFVGRVAHDALPQYYQMADLLVLPSIHQGEAFGMVLIEAMASGVPVLASDIPGVRKVATHAGRTVPPGDVGALASDILSYFSLPKPEQEGWKQDAQNAAETYFSFDKNIEKLDSLYKQLLGKKENL